MEENELAKRMFSFSIGVIRMLRTLEGSNDLRIISNQLVRSATSAGANYEESQGAVSRPDFSSKIGIVLKELRETNYWLRLLLELYPANEDIIRLCDESNQLKKIFGTISTKVNTRK